MVLSAFFHVFLDVFAISEMTPLIIKVAGVHQLDVVGGKVKFEENLTGDKSANVSTIPK